MPVIYTEKAEKDIEKLEKKIRNRVYKAIEKIEKGIIRRGKLKDQDDSYKIRVGKYRVIFDIDYKGNIIIIRIKLRKDVYRAI
jgi:mRNA interferase RelE/StbE